jgi:signal transduction histidine kinase
LGGIKMHIAEPHPRAQTGEAATSLVPRVSAALAGIRLQPVARHLETPSTIITLLAVTGVIGGLVIAALLSRDPREAGAYAVACIMIGGAMALAARTYGSAEDTAGDATAKHDGIRQEVRAVVHDIKAPLLTVSSYLELIASGAFGPVTGEAATALRRAAEVSGRACAVVETALDDLTLAGESAQPAVRVDLNETLSDVANALTAAMRERGASLAVSGPLPTVRAPEDDLFRVFGNLVQNAIKFCPEDRAPQIGVQARRLDGATVEVTVTDNGCGFPSDPSVLIEAGQRGANAVGVAGHGLGLATVARLVTRMGGTVAFVNAEGGGTTVRLTLPAA